MCVCVCACIYVFDRMCVWLFLCVHVCVYVCVCVCVCVCVYRVLGIELQHIAQRSLYALVFCFSLTPLLGNTVFSLKNGAHSNSKQGAILDQWP